MKRFVLLLLSVVILVPEVFANGRPLGPQRVLPEDAEMRISNRDITQYVFSPDSTQLAVVCTYSGIWVYDGRTGAEFALLTGHTDTVTAIKYSPDGKTIATGSLDRTVRLWDAQTFEHRATLEGHLGNTDVLAFSPDSKHLATGASHQVFPERLPRGRFHIVDPNDVESQPEKVIDGRVRLWNVATGELIKTMLTTDSGWVNRLVYASDDISLICVSTDGIYRIWNTETGQDKRFDTNYPAGNLTFSPDGTRFVQRMKDKTILCDADTGAEVATLETGSDNRFIGVVFSQNSETVMASHPDWNEFRFYDARTGQHRSSIPISVPIHQYFHGLRAMSADGNRFVIQEHQIKKYIEILDIQTGASALKLPIQSRVHSFRFSPDGRTLAMQGTIRSKHGNEYGLQIRLWNIPANTETGSIVYAGMPRHSHRGPFVAYGKGGILACGISESDILLFDAKSGKYMSTLKGHTNAVNTVSFSSDGTMLASASNDGTVRLWDTRTNKHLGTLDVKTNFERIVPKVHSVAFSVDGLKLVSVCSLDHTDTLGIHLWGVDTEELEWTLEGHLNAVFPIAISPDRTTLASSGLKGGPAIQLWDIRTGKLKATYVGHTNSVSALAYSPNGLLLASGGLGYNNKSVQIWNTTTGENHVLHDDVHTNPVISLTFSQDSRFLASSGGNNIEVWDVGFRQHKATLKGHRDVIFSLVFIGDGRLASASVDETIVLWKPVPPVEEKVVLSISPTSVVSPEIGQQLGFKVQIAGAEKVAAFQFTLQYDAAALRYISATNGKFLPDDAIFLKPVLDKGQITLTSTALTGEVSGDGPLATVTFAVVDTKNSTVSLHNASISDREGKRIRPTVKVGKVKEK